MVVNHLLKWRILQVGRKRWEQVKVYGGGNVVEVTLGWQVVFVDEFSLGQFFVIEDLDKQKTCTHLKSEI